METNSNDIHPRGGKKATFSNPRTISSFTFKVKKRFEEEVTEESEVSNIFLKPNTVMKERLLADSIQVKEGNPALHGLKLKQTLIKHKEKIRKCELGKGFNGSTAKVIMVVGATGAGKTTLINGLVNHVLGVDWKDKFRFQLIVDNEETKKRTQALSQTKWITSYTLHHQNGFQVPYSLTVIDTPGFGDTSGIKRDQEIIQQIRTFFTTEGDERIDHIDAVGFVTQASFPRLTPTQRYMFDQVLSFFGKDISDNIFLLVTFTDGQKPPVLEGVRMAAIPYKEYFKFNNSALYAENESGDSDSDDNDIDQMFWKISKKGFQQFLKTLGNTKPKSILLTQDVLNERHRLQTYLAGIQQHIRTGLYTLEQLQIEKDVLKRHETDIEKNKNFTYTVTEDVVKTEKLPSGTYMNNCLTCNFTCHYPCVIPDEEDKSRCAVMDKAQRFCTVCPGRCVWSVHKTMQYKIVIESVTKTKTLKELKVKYEAAICKKLSAEDLVRKVISEFESVQFKLLRNTEEVRMSLDRLNEIALKPNPLSTVEYIDILIMSEESQMLPKWRDRIKQLKEVRQQAETLQSLAKPGFDPFEKYKKTYLEWKKKYEKGPSLFQ